MALSGPEPDSPPLPILRGVDVVSLENSQRRPRKPRVFADKRRLPPDGLFPEHLGFFNRGSRCPMTNCRLASAIAICPPQFPKPMVPIFQYLCEKDYEVLVFSALATETEKER